MRFIPNAISAKLGRAALHLSKQSPKVLFVAGVAGTITTAVLASRATLKLNEVIDESQELLNSIEDHANSEDFETYTSEDAVKDKAIVYIRTGVKIAKLYAPAVASGALTIAAFTGSHRILTKRNAALTAAYAAVEKAFKEYRGRVIEDLGEDKDREYYLGLKREKVNEPSADGKSVKLTTKQMQTAESLYGKLYHDGNPNWRPSPDTNIVFLSAQQRYFNQLLQSRGHVFLNEVYNALGYEHTSAGAVTGWLKDSEDGDNYVDFGIFSDINTLHLYDYVQGKEGELFLNFNVQGSIWDRI